MPLYEVDEKDNALLITGYDSKDDVIYQINDYIEKFNKRPDYVFIHDFRRFLKIMGVLLNPNKNAPIPDLNRITKIQFYGLNFEPLLITPAESDKIPEYKYGDNG